MRSEHTKLLTPQEAARLLKIDSRSVHKLVQGGLLSAQYVKNHQGQASRRIPLNEVTALIDLDVKELTLPRVANLALRAFVHARDVGRRLGDLEYLLGIHTENLPTDEKGVVALCVEAQGLVDDPILVIDDTLAMKWARIFYAFTEEYLGLIHNFTASEEPWKVFMDLGDRIAELGKDVSPTVVSYLVAARRQLRTVAYFYLRKLKGAKLAGALFPETEGGVDEEILGLLFH